MQTVDTPTPPLIKVQFLEELSSYMRVLKTGSAPLSWSYDSLINFLETVQFM